MTIRCFRALLFALTLGAVLACNAREPSQHPPTHVGSFIPPNSSTLNWTTDFDCDLTAQSTQSLNADTTYTFCTKTWTKFNSAHDAVDGGVNITADSGLIVTPDSSSNISSSTFSAPTLRIPITSLVSGVTLSTPLRLWYWVSASNEAANSDQAAGGFFIYNGSYNNQFTMQFYRGFATGVDGFGAWFTLLQSNVTTTSTAVPFASGNRVVVATYPGGIIAGSATLQIGTTVTSGAWPALSSLVYVASPAITAGASGAGASTSSGQRTISDWNMFLTGERAGSGTSGFAATFGRVRVDHLAIF